MKVNEYKILSDAVEVGVSYGLNRAYKHTDNPSKDTIKYEIEEAVMSQICEYFNFEGIEEVIQ